MSRFFDLVTKPVREIGGYLPNPPAKPAKDEPQLIRLDSNENPLGPSPKAVEAMRAALSSTSVYPEDDCTQLRRRLAAASPRKHDINLPGTRESASRVCIDILTSVNTLLT